MSDCWTKKCIHDLFEEQAARTPNACAVIYNDDRLTYSELDRRSSILAKKLQTQGVGPDVVVALLVEKSVDMMVGMLGILKAGGAYAPIDPQYPQDRIEYILDDCGAEQLLLHKDTDNVSLPEYTGSKCMLDDPGLWGNLEPTDYSRVADVSNLCYIIYTSGSTGKPKGVELEHHGVVNMILFIIRISGMKEGKMVLQFFKQCFDAAVGEYFPAVCTGATLALYRGAGFADAIQRYQATHIAMTPSAAATLDPAANPSVEFFIVCGEACPMPLARRWAPHCNFYNLYGPTEATVYSHGTVIGPQCTHMSIGGVLNEHVQQYVVDERMNLLPPGEKGELLIGGVGIARGYHNKPEITEQKFIPNPFGKHAGDRLYRSGDLVVELEDSSLEFHGRIDNQVKLRGFRIELGEAETNLCEIDGIDDACCVVKDQRLIAFVTPSCADAGALVAAMKLKVPAFLVPAVVIPLCVFPLTPNDKTDRKALAAMDLAAFQSVDFVAARTRGEVELCALFGEVLGLPPVLVGARSSFFELGGHSLHAMRLVARVREATGKDLDASALYDAPHAQALAALLGDEGAAALAAAPPIARVPRPAIGEPPLAASQSQEQMHLLWGMDKRSVTYNCPFALRVRGALEVHALERTQAWLAERHEVLRTTLSMGSMGGIGGMGGMGAAAAHARVVQRVAERGSMEAARLRSFEVRSAASAEDAQALLHTEAATVFDLERGPVFRMLVVHEHERVHGGPHGSEETHWIVLSLHHAAVDGWSINVLRAELLAGYAHFCDHGCAPSEALMPTPVLQFADYAAWQRLTMGAAGPKRVQQLHFWLRTLRDAPALALPLDRPRPTLLSGRGACVPLRLPPALVRGFKALGAFLGASPSAAFLAAWQLLLARHSCAEDAGEVVCGVPYAGRARAEVQSLVGCFVNPLAVRTAVLGKGAGDTFADLLARVQDALRGAISHADVAFAEVVRALGDAQGGSVTGSTPVFQTMLAYNSFDGQEGHVQRKQWGHGLTTLEERTTMDNGTSKFEVSLTLSDGGDGGLVGELEYSTDLFDRSTVEYMGEHFKALLHALVHDSPSTPLKQIRMMSAAEEKMITVDWNTTRDEGRRFVVDEFLKPVPVGVPGEIAIVGLGIKTGHLNRARMNKANFFAERFSDGAGGDTHVHRTGDRARLRADGRLELLGRICGSMDARREGAGQCVDADEAQTQTQARVLQPDGEINRAAFPPPSPDWDTPQLQQEEASAAAAFASHRGATETEEAVHALFAETLQRPRAAVSATASFFELGGHSLSAAQLVVAVQDAFGLTRLPLAVFFECPSVRALSAVLDTMAASDATPAPGDSPAPRMQAQVQARMQSLDLDDEARAAFPVDAFEGFEDADWEWASGELTTRGTLQQNGMVEDLPNDATELKLHTKCPVVYEP